MKTGNLNIEQKLSRLKVALEKTLPDKLGNLAYDHFMEGFPSSNSQRGGRRTDKSSNGWLPRKGKPNHPPLQASGDLKRSIKTLKKKFKVIIYTNISYASYHNEGTGRLPQREFIGKSKKLDKKSKDLIKNVIKLIL